MRFVKMHGLGNDFVVVDAIAERPPADPAAIARRVCDRHEGVGADGLLLMLPPEKGVDAALRMVVCNADGSEPEMCGNGIRCVCKLAHDRGISRENPMRIQTGRGVLSLRWTVGKSGHVAGVTVDMGEPILDAAKIPVRLGDLPRVVDESVPLAAIFGDDAERMGIDARMTCVSMGNPHAVFWCKDAGALPLARLGPRLERHAWFPAGTNVHFVQVLGPSEAKVRTWERGAGATLACGTGASAACVAGVLTKRASRRLWAHMPGGDLDLEWSERDGHVYMTGPAVTVFSGEWPD